MTGFISIAASHTDNGTRSRVPLLGESTDAPLKLNLRPHAKLAAMKQPGLKKVDERALPHLHWLTP
jgi:hypothetical protein